MTYRLQVAAPSNNDGARVTAFEAWIKQRIEAGNIKGVRVESLENGRPEMRDTLDRADRFLSLVGLLSAMLAAVAVAMAARRFMQRHLDACAMLRCLGLTQNQVTAHVPGRIRAGRPGRQRAGRAGRLRRATSCCCKLVGSLLAADLPPVSLLPALQGVATGMLLLVGFALPPILQLRNVPHNRVIRREQARAASRWRWPPMAWASACSSALLLWQAGDVKLALLTAGGFLGGFARVRAGRLAGR